MKFIAGQIHVICLLGSIQAVKHSLNSAGILSWNAFEAALCKKELQAFVFEGNNHYLIVNTSLTLSSKT